MQPDPGSPAEVSRQLTTAAKREAKSKAVELEENEYNYIQV